MRMTDGPIMSAETPPEIAWVARYTFARLREGEGMSGFHLASIGFLGTSRLYGPPSRLWAEQARCCSFIRTILRIIRVNGSIIQQKRRALCMWCRRPCWEKPLCDNDCVVRQPGTCREEKIFRKYEHQDMIFTFGVDSTPALSSMTDLTPKSPK